MARPLSEEKRKAILTSAVGVISTQGLNATTALIAKEAGISAGSLFTYFPSKDELLNQLYLALKQEVASEIMCNFPLNASVEDRAHHIWQSYVFWAFSHVDKRRTLQQLAVSHLITDETRNKSAALLADVNALLNELEQEDAGISAHFVAAIMTALADTTVDFMLAEPARSSEHAAVGFKLFWRAMP
ncbi:TetR/AcrR family transcriptional regulator [Yersinia kristensenii]|uniref:HTH-type transcriptional repressor Bm3R1 n=1 Tax=Yersinia kristensenii TaxID=28152 RepID=A0A0T9KNP7_YERKR|nr:TetR/AcrR family transcriptional regulator [Yersinia kristensenii]MDA5472149.1 TetR/AcrR family transcriptional regulator [Yersinia kristensenii]MDA5478262.1 TetR/AcrR family transcriptional regulator [Yersinia kristensenii]MDA5505554.1 TetR/AcrR family transcriptional regulator [Yersinia kristensenii]MDA5523226.1 TetR/AcrR family transcriptional regulator [Yersinia kristensenii]MDR4899254.1 TetR/AcrR family transcriptional regulator [Yersinia kristensenii]